ncbi:hypothetical protein [Cryobacterium sp. TMT4-31]|uniref:hypothetical protein n=1 Tax=Cryobacterium sp. TMT4-31 TaxID=1259259 RepID=UPI00106D5719|nr:hypothetical protein [Cryobacterium sp. TMT4-31]TFC87445.1 hypothetical protein E3T19_12480 [Cryobacterium sp. TMT4-31]
MTQTPELIYCLRGARACQTHRVSYRAWERYINAELAALTGNGDPVLNEAIITGIWGQDVASAAKASCNCGWGDWSVSERGNDADWLASCLCQEGRALTAEHKPRWAAAHWKQTPLAAFRSRAIVPGQAMDWLLAVDPGCDSEHSIASCNANHPRFYRDTDQKSHLAAPQILAYSHTPGSEEVREITVINDGSLDVNVIWDTNDVERTGARKEPKTFPIFLDTTYFPVRTTADVLNGIAKILPREKAASLIADNRATLRAIFEAMWVRAGTPEISSAAESWVRQDVRDCIRTSRHELVDEEPPAEHDFQSWKDYVGSAHETA